MAEPIAKRFIAALRTLEQTRDVEPLVALYGEDSHTENVLSAGKFQGRAGARQFWSEYRGTFGEAVSEFRNVIQSENRAALEWTTTGTNFDGGPLQYGGVTILETDGEFVTRSCAYFDPTALGRQMDISSL